MKVNQEQLKDILVETGCDHIEMIINTDPKLLKRGNPLAKSNVVKRTEGIFSFGGQSFGERVNEQLDRIGEIDEDYKTGSLPWGKWVENGENKVIEHKGSYYLRYYIDGPFTTIYKVDGQDANEEQLEIIKTFTKEKSSGKKQEDLGIAKKDTIKPCVVNFENIEKIVIDGITYELCEQ